MQWLHELIEAHPGADLAIIDHDGTRFDYGQLREMVGRAAKVLAGHGLRAGDRMLLVCENSASYAVMVLAAARCGAWVSPVNARQSEDEIEAIRRHSGARMAVFTPEASPNALAHGERMGAQALGALPCGVILATPVDPGAVPEPVEDDPRARVAALMYTTGTTSAPKGVMLTHSNLMWNAEVSARLRMMKPGEVVLGVLPGTHIFCFASAFLATLHAGSAIRFIPRFSADAVLAAFAEGDHVMPAVPQMYQAIIQTLAARGETTPNAPGLRYISSGGAPLDPEWKERIETLFGIPLMNGYGLTETSPGVSGTRIYAPRNDVSVGEVLDDVDCVIDDPDDEGVGELLIRGPNIMKGYYRAPELTAEVMTEDNFFRSGDFAKIEDGALWIMGRKKELIIRSGFNVYPPEVEAMLTRHPDVRVTAVVGRRVPGNEEILAFVQAAPGTTEADLKGYLHEHLVGYKVPQHIFIVDHFPTAATGKILKHKLVGEFAALIDARDAARTA